MNKLNFNPQQVTNYPMSIERMASLQYNLSVAAGILADIQPQGACILSGCETIGSAGYVRLNTGTPADPVYEIFEVPEYDQTNPPLGNNPELVRETSNVQATNSEGASVVVEELRRVQWAPTPTNSTLSTVYWKDLPRAILRTASPDTNFELCPSPQSLDTSGVTDGQMPQARRCGGRLLIQARVHLTVTDDTKPLLYLPLGLTVDHDVLVPYTVMSGSGSVVKIGSALLRPLAGISVNGSPLWAPQQFSVGVVATIDINAAIDL